MLGTTISSQSILVPFYNVKDKLPILWVPKFSVFRMAQACFFCKSWNLCTKEICYYFNHMVLSSTVLSQQAVSGAWTLESSIMNKMLFFIELMLEIFNIAHIVKKMF